MTERLYPGTSRVALESGLRVIVEEAPVFRSVSLGIWVRAGSRDDPGPLPGLTHFLEHLLFKGTRSRDAMAISRAIDGIGGHLNGATGKEVTFLYADVPADGLEIALDVLSDLCQHPAIGREELENERGVVLDELRGRDDDPEQVAHELFAAGLWRDGHPLSRPVLGEKKTIETASADDLRAHHQLFYQPENVVLVACGAVKTERVVRLAAKLFEQPEEPLALPARTPPTMQKGRSTHARGAFQTHFYVGLPGIRAADPGRFALEALDTVVGAGPSSRLFRLVREERGLAYTVGSYGTYHSDAGFWTIYAGCAPGNVGEVSEVILSEVEHVRKDGITSEELELAKAKLRGTLILSLDSTSDRMARLGSAAVVERETLSPEELIARLESVTLDDVAAMIDGSVRLEASNVAVIGPQGGDVAGHAAVG